MKKMESRKDFYANEMNYERMESKLEDVCKNLTLAEVLKMVREISYDMVAYYSEDHKGIIYCDEKYSDKNQWEACQLQRLLSSACDMFGQSIIEHREFGESYLNHWLNGGTMENQISDLKNEIEALKDQVQEWKNRCYDLEREMEER